MLEHSHGRSTCHEHNNIKNIINGIKPMLLLPPLQSDGLWACHTLLPVGEECVTNITHSCLWERIVWQASATPACGKGLGGKHHKLLPVGKDCVTSITRSFLWGKSVWQAQRTSTLPFRYRKHNELPHPGCLRSLTSGYAQALLKRTFLPEQTLIPQWRAFSEHFCLHKQRSMSSLMY